MLRTGWTMAKQTLNAVMPLRVQAGAWIAALTCLAAAAPSGAQAATIDKFSPQGEVRAMRQVAVRFSEDIVKFGDLQSPTPFNIECSETGQGRWLDARAWVFDFTRDLPPGVKCSFTLKPDTKPLAGGSFTGKTAFTFSTGGPAVLQTQPYQGSESIDEEQTFILRLNGAVNEASVLEKAWCAAEGIGERIPATIIGGPARADFFKALKRDKDAADEKLLLLKCKQRFAAGANVSLIWGRGITTNAADVKQRVATSQDQPLKFKVRPEFKVSFTCARDNANAPCSPYQPMSLEFPATVSRSMADGIRIKTSDGDKKPAWSRDDSDGAVNRATFNGPFPESAEISITLPAKFADDTGRAPVNAASFPLKSKTGEGTPLAKFAANFGIIELAQPVLPVTIRNVESQLKQATVSVKANDAPAAGPGVVPPAEAAAVRAEAQKNAAARGAAVAPAPPARGAPVNRVRITDDAQIMAWLARLRHGANNEFRSREFAYLRDDKSARSTNLPASGGGKMFEVIGIPLPEAGFHVVEIESERLGAALLAKPKPMYVRAGALVTNMAVHFKMGRADGSTANAGSAVWVTTLDAAKPVADARIRISDCAGAEVWAGKTDENGVAMVAQTLRRESRCGGDAPAYFVSARKGEDLSFTLSDWQNGIEPWRFNVSQGYGSETSVVAHTVFDRPLFRAGETVSMKHYLRAETLQGFAALPAGRMPNGVTLTHVGSGTDYQLPLTFGGRGSASHAWKISPDAKLGEYSVTLTTRAAGGNAGRGGRGEGGRGEGGRGDGSNGASYQTGSFRVAEFRLPVMQGAVTSPKEPQVKVQEVAFNLALSYLSGGPAPGHAVKMTAVVRNKSLSFGDYEEFSFGMLDERGEGMERVEGESDAAQSGGSATAGDLRDAGNADKLVADKNAVKLGNDGTARYVVKNLPKSDRPRELLTEMTYRDPNGEEQTLRGSTTLWPSAVIAGIKSEGWVQVKKIARLQVLVLDLNGKPKADAPVKVRGALKTTTSTRKRTVGGFYTYDNKTEEKDLGIVCSGKSDTRGLMLCEATLTESGNVTLTAQAEDASGNASRASSSIWVSGGEWWFGGDNADRMDVLPEKKRYQPGDTAKFQVRMPFRNATAWVAIEREGVIETLVLPLTGKDPVVSIPIKAGYAPNAFISVLAVRGRVRDVPWYSFLQWGWRAPVEWWNERNEWVNLYNKGEPTALVDLAKPAFKFGIAEVQVGTAAYELKVSVAADKPVYQTRETAKVRISVKGPDGKPAPKGTEVALAAVDQALLELMPNTSWNILEAMVKRRSYYVDTATAQMQVIGRRHFGKKALPPGGGGGRGSTRELFDTLLVWMPDVTLDDKGEALVDVALNDALTSFKIVAVADSASEQHGGLFGSGSVTVRATKDLQLLAGLPPLVREGDQFRAGVTVRNTTARAMRVTVNAKVEGLAAQPQAQEISLAPGTAQEVYWPVTVPMNVTALAWTIEAVEKISGAPARDAMKTAQKVVPAVPVTVQQATLLQLDKSFAMQIAPPADALQDGGIARGGLRVALQPKLSGSLEGVRRFFEDYPFICLEQKTSKSIGLRNKALWQTVANAIPHYLDEDGLAAYFPGSRGSDTLTAYLLAVTNEAGYAVPDNARERMEGALVAFVEGRIQRNFWSPTKDLAVRKISAIEALSRTGKATPKLLESITLQPNLWPTHAVIDWLSILQRVQGIPKRDEHLASTEQVLRARLSMQGTKMVFSTEREDYWWWLMVGGDVNAARLIATVVDRPGWREDMPRLVSGLVARQNKGAWHTTTANLWGGLALDKFAAKFESEKVAGITRAGIEEKGETSAIQQLAWGAQAQGGVLNLPWPKAGAAAPSATAQSGGAAPAIKAWHEGAGKPWLTIQSLAAIPLKAPFAAGYRINKTVTSVEQKTKGVFTRGDVLRIKLEVDSSADMTWVVVADPIPAGATILGAGLARDSDIAQQGERKSGEAWPAYEERSFEAFRAYYEYAPRGKWMVEYTVRLNQDGEFSLPPTRVEAMYAPEMFGVAPNARMKVLP